MALSPPIIMLRLCNLAVPPLSALTISPLGVKVSASKTSIFHSMSYLSKALVRSCWISFLFVEVLPNSSQMMRKPIEQRCFSLISSTPVLFIMVSKTLRTRLRTYCSLTRYLGCRELTIFTVSVRIWKIFSEAGVMNELGALASNGLLCFISAQKYCFSSSKYYSVGSIPGT